MEQLEIGEVARRAGIAPSALRYYESAGLMPSPQRRNGRRRYAPDAIQRLAVITAAQSCGFTLAEIRTLLDGFTPGTSAGDRWRALAEVKLPELDEQIARLQQMKATLEMGLHCECLTFEE